MTATIRLFLAPTRAERTAALLSVACTAAHHDPGSVLWLTATPRAADDLRRRVRTGLCGLHLMTFAELAALVLEESPAHPVSGAQRRVLAEEVASELAVAGSLDHFAAVSDTSGFVHGLLGMLSELHRAGYRAGTDLSSSLLAGPTRDCARLVAHFQDTLRHLGLRDPEADEIEAGALLRRTVPVLLGDLRLVLTDAELTPARLGILDALARHGAGIQVGLLDEPGDERGELFTLPRQVRAALVDAEPVVVASTSPGATPPGLVHLRHQLFRPLRRIEASHDATGIERIEAPGRLGEVRLVARRIRALLVAGIPTEEILVVARDLAPYADLVREVFDAYGIPLEMDGTDPLLRQPAVALLLRALRLPEEDFPFAAVTALLRHTSFRPAWPEAGDDMPTRTEALLRLLAEPRGRAAYLAAVDRWAEEEQPGLEDEAAEESRRRRIHELAKQCQAFLHRFFRCWDEAPERGSVAEHAAWLWRLADELGIASSVGQGSDGAALDLLRGELALWQARQQGTMERRTFARRLTGLATAAGLPRTPTGPGRVRFLTAEEACHLSADHLFLLGLGEKGFPRAGMPPSLLDDTDREAFGLPGLDPLPAEMLLFYQIVTAARRQLVLSYPAVDERGQEMLPGAFLLAVLDCFAEGAIPVQRQRMLIEGLARDMPLSPAESRIRIAASWPAGAGQLEPNLRAHLTDAAALAHARFRDRDFTPYDGMFRDRLLVEWVGRHFPPQRVFSPTALEEYIACPFRFFLHHVLHLEPLAEPSEEIERTRRGMAYHRALARLHRQLRERGTHQPTPEVETEVLREVEVAITEDIHRAPGPATRALWQLEGQRLLRSARRYAGHWGKFVQPWIEHGVAPQPHLFEVDFGLPVPEGQPAVAPLLLRAGEIEVRISGRIDRVDLAELEDGVGFWVIDYKTGRAGHYTGTDLAQFRKLQLTLYALAVESVLLPGQSARPLGLAYWLVTDSGPKVVLPGRSVTQWLHDDQRWPALRAALVEWVATLVRHIRQGAFPLAPRSEHCTLTCPYQQVCRISQARAVDKTWPLEPPTTS